MRQDFQYPKRLPFEQESIVSELSKVSTNSQQDAATRIASGLVGKVVRSFGKVRLCVFGTSMVPSILPGDLISIQ